MKCRFCGSPLNDVFLDLGAAPPSNAFLTREALGKVESYFPLKLYTCATCHLVQVDEVQSHDALFDDDYVYFSSYSRSWLKHAEVYVDMVTERLALDANDLVIEIASNDGYLLQYVAAKGIPCLGIEPTAGTAAVAREKGIETIESFFGNSFAMEFAKDRRQATLVTANNVLAHVPDLNDFVAGLATVLSRGGTITVEFPHLLELVEHRQFDTVYHEHFSYLSLHTVKDVFAAHGLEIWDVERLTTHGGSLRVWGCHAGDKPVLPSVSSLLELERVEGMLTMAYYGGFQAQADEVKNAFLEFLLCQKREGRKVAAYGAAAKGNTLINYAGVRSDLIAYVVDANPHKQGRWLPGSRIPVVAEEHLRQDRPDVVIILPWNLREEISAQLAYVREWGGRLATFVPSVVVS
ncbi:class I SAM-dependent methyltransferase [Pinirhizobacter soli]|uniref:class I SAM-dependent methyltransferase n=1 Tax=Pinirhizobacter soli TaxID=2786953 RepID=UPI002029CFDC|nr:class I SAM-dependent methyltransferase [Pinirhizobacter soli]